MRNAANGIRANVKKKFRPFLPSNLEIDMSNISRVRIMANKMADEIRLCDEFRHLPDWAGLAWIISPYYNTSAHKVYATMPFEWLKRAKRLVAAMDIAWQWKRDQEIESTCRKG